MEIKVLKSYNDAPHFPDSSKDSFFEVLLDGKINLRVVRCDDKHSRYVSYVEILAFSEKPLIKVEEELSKLGYDIDAITSHLEEILS